MPIQQKIDQQEIIKNAPALQTIKKIEYEGPIPPPVILEGYDRLVPGAAERIISMAEESAKFYQEITLLKLKSEIGIENKGLNYALIISVCCILSGLVAIWLGNPGAGATIITGTLTGGIVTFITGKNKINPKKSGP
ncbi:MAG: DUF2335 domain-containing protein [Magnetococcales bacterium]|nr:DUF2335 domain-containing protein [Magnetococcales bacterium]